MSINEFFLSANCIEIGFNKYIFLAKRILPLREINSLYLPEIEVTDFHLKIGKYPI
jgi:hypothetical protein